MEEKKNLLTYAAVSYTHLLRFQRRIPIFIIRKQTIWRRSLPAILGLRIWKKVMKFPWMRTMEPLQLIGQEMNIMIPGTMLEATE